MEKKTFSFEVKSIDDNGIVEGYVSTFDNLDRDDDIVDQGAFTKTLSEHTVDFFKVLWQHMSIHPIGQPLEIREDAKGLFVRFQLFIKDDPDNNIFKIEKARESFTLLKGVEGKPAVDGFSIGFSIPEGGAYFKDGKRHIIEIDLFEWSIVTFAANTEARPTSVKAAGMNEKDFERKLRDAVGLSRSEAKTLMSKGFKAIGQRDADNSEKENKEADEAIFINLMTGN